MVSRELLLEKVWGYEYFGDIRTVDVTVRRIREKIEDDTTDPQILVTKRGIGYYIAIVIPIDSIPISPVIIKITANFAFAFFNMISSRIIIYIFQEY